MAHGIGFLLFSKHGLINGYLKDHNLFLKSFRITGMARTLICVTQKCGELLIRQAQPGQEPAPAWENRSLLRMFLVGTAHERDHTVSGLSQLQASACHSEAQEGSCCSTLAEQEHFINQKDMRWKMSSQYYHFHVSN